METGVRVREERVQLCCTVALKMEAEATGQGMQVAYRIWER